LLVISELPAPIDLRDTYWDERITIPNTNKTLIFVFNSYPEKSMGPNEELIVGVYRNSIPEYI